MGENLSASTSIPLSSPSSTNDPNPSSSPNDSPTSSDVLPIWRIIVYSSLAFFTLIYLTATILLFYTRRQRITDIQFRPLRLNILNTIATIMLCVTFCLRTAFWPNAYPCFLIHWPIYIGFFLWCTALVCRVLSFTWVARFNLAKLRMSKAYRNDQGQQTGLMVTITQDRSEGMGREREKRGSALLSRFRKFKDCATDKWLARFILYPTMTLAFILTLVLQLTSKELYPTNKVCSMGFESIILLALLGIFLLIICPILFYMIYDIRDAYGVRSELVFTMVAGAITYVGYILFQEVMPVFREYFGSYIFGWVAFIFSHTLTITMPLLKTYKRGGSSKSGSSLSRLNSCSSRISVRKNSRRFAQFMDVLGKPELFAQYKECAAACFCTELVLFLEEYQFLKVLVAQCCQPGHSMTVENASILEPPELSHTRPTSTYSLFPDTKSFIMRPATPIAPQLVSTPCTIPIVETISAAKWIPFPNELWDDYKTFYDMFFDSSSDLAINIRGSTVATVKNQIMNGEFEIAMFDQAREEVLVLLYRNTFERFCKMFGYDFEQEGRV